MAITHTVRNVNISSDAVDLDALLASFPNSDGIVEMASNRDYASAEEDYDAQYSAHRDGIHSSGALVASVFEEMAPSLQGGVCLEVGAGTGSLTTGLVMAGQFERYLVTDGSSAFLRIARNKLEAHGIDASRVWLARLNGDDLSLLNFDRFSLIALRSVLHHFERYDEVFAQLVKRLRPGGIIAMLEPRAEFFVHTSVLLRLAPLVGMARGVPLSASDVKTIESFQAATKFYLSRTIDKTGAEDRYAFSTDELANLASNHGMRLRRNGGEHNQGFAQDFRNYLIYCMSYPVDLVDRVQAAVGPEASYIDEMLRDLVSVPASEWLFYQRPF